MMSPENQKNDFLFMAIVSFYIGALILANVLNVSRIIHFEIQLLSHSVHFLIPIGLICYPITFLCTDLICELYDKKTATDLVWTGFWVNLCVVGVILLAGKLPFFIGSTPDAFSTIYELTLGCTLSSCLSYIVAQRIDVAIYHKLKILCRNKHLWLRNNASTMISQCIDTIIVVIMVKWLTGAYPNMPNQDTPSTLIQVMASIYLFKFLMAILDTLPLYLIVHWARRKKTAINQICVSQTIT